MAVGSSEYFHLLTRRKDFHVGFEAPLSEEEAMMLAFRRAMQGLSSVAPNPPVGCVILDKDNRLISDGYHVRAGEGHAEINALKRLWDVESLKDVGGAWSLSGLPLEVLKGAKLFVTLEPCAHRGRTPSCARTLAQLPLEQVIYGIPDPNPLVSGKGAQIVRDAGIHTTCWSELSQAQQAGRWADALSELIEIFRVNMLEERMFVSSKFATSMDGMMALADGSSQWITSEKSREFGVFLRGIHDAVLVGIETVIRDNPVLNMRHPEHKNKKGHLVILDPHGKIHLQTGLKLFNEYASDKLHVFSNLNLEGVQLPFQHYPCPRTTVMDLGFVLDTLYKKGLRSVFVEGGAFTVSEFLRQNLVDRVWHFEAPILMGRGRHWTQQLQFSTMDQAIKAVSLNSLDLGPDRLTTFRVK